MRIVAYTYASDVHCPVCTKDAWILGATNPSSGLHHPPTTLTLRSFLRDEHEIPVDMIDSEGNPVHPIFDTDEDLDGSLTYCGDCHEKLK